MVFADTSFLVALLHPRDGRHADAVALNAAAVRARRVITTNHIVGESWTLAMSRYGHHVAAKVLRAVQASAVYSVHHATPLEERQAAHWLLRHDEREYSFIDAVSFAVMRDRGIEEALAFDADFEAAGFRTLRP